MMKSIKPYEKYKNSGIAWLGDIPESWEVVKLGSLFSERREKVSDTEFKPLSVTKNGIVPQLDNAAKTMHGDNRKKVCKGDFVINSRSDRKGSSGLAKEDGSVSVINIALKPRDINPKYSEYLLKNYFFKEEYYRFGRGIVADLWTTRYSEMKNMELPKTHSKEQEKIANFLDYKTAKIDRFIAKKKQLIKLLNEQKAGIINDAVTKGLNPNAKTKPSGIEWLGDIPAHWEVKKLKGICKAFGRIGFRGYKTTDLVSRGEGAVTISTSNMKYDFMTFEKCTYLSWDKYEESPEIKIFNDDIIMVKTGSTYGKVGIVKNLDEKATINPQLLVLKEVGINPNYLYLLLKSNLVQTQVKTEVIGSTIPTISQTKILNFRLVVPPRSEIESILRSLEKETATINKTITTIEKEITLVQEYRTALIAEAVTGKIDVRDYEIGSIEAEEALEELEIMIDDLEKLEGLEEQDEN